jgi:hypothetical protein
MRCLTVVKRFSAALLVLCSVAGSSARDGSAAETQEADKEEEEMLTVTSEAFEANEPIPRKYTREGEDISPPLAWEGAPNGVESYALIVDDPNAPRPEPWVHWVVYNIPAKTTSLPEGSAGGAVEGVNDFDKTGYGGPMPPQGHGTHHYHFKVYALDTTLDLKPGATKGQVLEAMEGHLLEEGELVGTYER